ncbi:molecular chaperone DnaJ [Arenicella chitinivorans]|uniref:Molecular chaperone DnaJ n=1 Tax=Arenicella chitinivorans TaxID=1329800 RepID=A0A918VKC6_9GAMM|nr:molecular chaperone DnaJ [Arenicella chitinivorans]
MPTDARRPLYKKWAVYGSLGVVLALVVAGRAHWVLGIMAGLLAIAARAIQFAPYVPIFKRFMVGADATDSDGPNSVSTSMTRSQAAEILGVDENAPVAEVKAAHKSLMQKMHPDRGGSPALAKQINRAKDVLLG